MALLTCCSSTCPQCPGESLPTAQFSAILQFGTAPKQSAQVRPPGPGKFARPDLERQEREGRVPKGQEPFPMRRNGRLRSNAQLEVSLWLCTQNTVARRSCTHNRKSNPPLSCSSDLVKPTAMTGGIAIMMCRARTLLCAFPSRRLLLAWPGGGGNGAAAGRGVCFSEPLSADLRPCPKAVAEGRAAGLEFASLRFSLPTSGLLDWEFASLLLSPQSSCLTRRWQRRGRGALCRKGV